jgi:hypothetical protein
MGYYTLSNISVPDCPIQVLRISLEQHRAGTNVGDSQAFPAHQREELVQQLEILSLKVHIESPHILLNLRYYICDIHTGRNYVCA